MWQVNRLVPDRVQRNRVELRKYVTRDPAYRHGFPRANDEIREHHHPPGREAYVLGEHFCRVRDLGGSVGNGHDELRVDVADGQKQGAANREPQNGSHRTATAEPVVHDDQPTDANHGSPAKAEVVGQTQLSSEVGRGKHFALSTWHLAFGLPAESPHHVHDGLFFGQSDT